MADGPGLVARWTRPESRTRRLLLAAFVYLVCIIAFATVAGPERLLQHTQYNHYALLADAWLHGRQFLAGGPPAYLECLAAERAGAAVLARYRRAAR